MDDAAYGPASIAALREAVRNGREPPPARIVARLTSYRWFVVGTVCVGAFMGQVDSSIAQMLLPRLELEFGARLSTVSWVAVAYLLAMAAFLPIFGRLADMVGRKLLYTGGFLLFVLSSALCGLAPSLPVLIAFRIAQGIGAALLSSNSVAIVVTAAGPAQRGRALGVLSAAQAVGLSAGPALGGLVLDLLDWRWVFWINVPVGLAGTVLGWFVLPPTQDLPADSRFDWKGAFLIAPALTAFVAGNAAGLMGYAALFGLFFLMPFIFVRAYRDSTFAAGLRLSIVPVMLGVVAPVAGALCDRLGARMLTVSGMLICVVASALLFAALDGAPASLPLVMLALAIFGIGQGLFISPNNSAVVAAAPAALTGEAGGLLNVMRSCGISIGVAAASSLLAWRLALRTGSGHDTLHAEAQQLLAAGRDVTVLLGSFAAMAGVISLARLPSRRSGDAKDAST